MILGIYGSGGLGREVLELAKQINMRSQRWNEIIFIDDFRTEKVFKSHSVYPFESIKSAYDPENIEIVIGIGEPKDREKLCNIINQNGFHLATLIHPNVHIPDSTTIGEGGVICINTVISCDVVIGKNVYIQPNALVGHDVVIGKNTVISGLVQIAGHCQIGDSAYLGMNVCIKEEIRIGNDTIVGMGSVVMRDIPDEMIVLGNPARSIRKNEDKKVFK